MSDITMVATVPTTGWASMPKEMPTAMVAMAGGTPARMPRLIRLTLLQPACPAAARPAITIEVTAGCGGAALDLVVERDGDLCGDEGVHVRSSAVYLQS